MQRRLYSRLAWITVGIAVAMYLAFTAGVTHCRGPKIRTEMALKDITLGIKNYHVEYDRYPGPVATGGSEPAQRYLTNGTLLACLLGNNAEGLNPREISFIEPPMAHDGRSGLIPGTSLLKGELVDGWGHPYVVMLNLGQRHQLANPDRHNTNSRVRVGAPELLPLDVLAYSLGPDGIEGTIDDLVSWRGVIPSRADEIWRLALWGLSLGMIALVVNAAVQVLLMMRDGVRWLVDRKRRAD